MRISQLTVQNYKSLRAIDISPTQLSVLVGSNASGKTNFADCLDFISEVYRHGLEVAISRKGGYENIAFRKMRRSKSPVSISISIELSRTDWPIRRFIGDSEPDDLKVEHSFSFVARGYSIRAEFEVTQESVVVSRRKDNGWNRVATIVRDKNGDFVLNMEDGSDPIEQVRHRRTTNINEFIFDFSDIAYFIDRSHPTSATELLVTSIGRIVPSISAFIQAAGGIRVFQISPTKSREYGVPTPTPELDRTGANLPAVIDLMKKTHPQEWQLVMHTMRAIVPGLKRIDVDYTPSKTLGLFFREDGFGRPWNVEEVSDGTIQTLALLVAIFDPTSTALIVEEPENSIHPWIIRHIIDACRDASNRKQIIMTTHSPIVINAVKPEEVWVMWRSNGESHIANFLYLDPGFLHLWQGGDIPTFDYIDSGALDKAIPPAPSLDLELEEE